MSEPTKMYNPAEPVTITLTMEQWEHMRHSLLMEKDYHRAKMQEWLAVCKDPKMAREKAAAHEKTAAQAETLCKIIEETLCPPPPRETEE